MRNILIAALMIICFISCKREKPVDPLIKKHALILNVTGFTQTTGPFASSFKSDVITGNADTLSEYIDRIVFIVYDSQNQVVTTKTQLSSQANYTSFTDSLPSGTYTVVFVGGNPGLAIQTNLGTGNDSFYYGGLQGASWKDCFFKKISVTVTADPIQQSVQLDRVTAQLQLKITDPIPDNIVRIGMSYNDHQHFGILDGEPRSYMYTVKLVDSIAATDIGISNHLVKTYTLNNGTPFDLTVSAYDGTNKIIAQKTVLNVNCVRNKRTILSGNLFSSSGVFKVTTDTIWNTPINHPF